MLTNLTPHWHPLVVGLVIVLAEMGGVALVTGLVLAAHRLRPALPRVPASSRQARGGVPR